MTEYIQLANLKKKIILLHFWKFSFLLSLSSSSSSSSSVLPKGRSFTASARNKTAVLPKAGLPLQTQESRLKFYQGWIGAVASRFFPHPTLSLASEQVLKDLKRSQGHRRLEVRRVALVNLSLRTSPKFITGVKYQLHQGFWPDQRFGNLTHYLNIRKNYFFVLYK